MHLSGQKCYLHGKNWILLGKIQLRVSSMSIGNTTFMLCCQGGSAYWSMASTILLRSYVISYAIFWSPVQCLHSPSEPHRGDQAGSARIIS